GEPLGSSVRQYARRPHHAEGLRRLHRVAGRTWTSGYCYRCAAAPDDGCAYGSGVPHLVHSGICVCNPHLHVPERRGSPEPLIIPFTGGPAARRNRNLEINRSLTWKRKQHVTSAQVLLALAWLVRHSASATSSVATSRALCATRQLLTASSAA